TAREFPGKNIDKALADELGTAVPERAALVVLAMADRPDTVILPAVLKAAGKGPKVSRLAAVSALAPGGNNHCLSTLLDSAIESDEDIIKAAKATLADLPGDGVDKSIVGRLAKAEGSLYLALIELVGQRRIEAITDLQKALNNQDKTIRHAAL